MIPPPPPNAAEEVKGFMWQLTYLCRCLCPPPSETPFLPVPLLAAEEVKSIMWQLTHCLKYLHDLHVWHRDLKSQNVFVTWEAGELVVKVGALVQCNSNAIWQKQLGGPLGGRKAGGQGGQHRFIFFIHTAKQKHARTGYATPGHP